MLHRTAAGTGTLKMSPSQPCKEATVHWKTRRRLTDVKKPTWSFEPSYCWPPTRECYAPSEAFKTRQRFMQSTFYDEMTNMDPLPEPPPRPDDRTHNHLFGPDPPFSVPRRLRIGHNEDGRCLCPQWTSTDCQPLPPENEFTRSKRNVYGEEKPSDQRAPLRFPPRPISDFHQSHTHVFGPADPPVCIGCLQHPAPGEIVEYERTRHNVIGPQTPPPPRYPVRHDALANSQRNVFGPGTPAPLRYPQRTTDYDETKQHVFGSDPPYERKASLQPPEDTFNDLFGKPISYIPKYAPAPLQRHTDIFTATDPDPPRSQAQPQASFATTYQHLFGPQPPYIHKPQYRQDENTFKRLFGKHLPFSVTTGKKRFDNQADDTHDTIFGRYPLVRPEPPEREDTLGDLFGITKSSMSLRPECMARTPNIRREPCNHEAELQRLLAEHRAAANSKKHAPCCSEDFTTLATAQLANSNVNTG